MRSTRAPRSLPTSILSTVFLPLAVLGLGNVGNAAAQTGACCPSCDLDECVIVTEAECQSLAGWYQGDGTTCDDCPDIATIPDPANCSVVPADALNGLFVSPSAPIPIEGSEIVVSVRNNCDDPMENAWVTVELTDGNPLCGGVELSAVTNGSGEARIVLSGSGCAHDVPLSGLIKSNGVTIRAYSNVKGPDIDRSGQVELGDLISFSNEFLGVTPSECHDYDNNGTTALPDLVLFAPAFVAASHCP